MLQFGTSAVSTTAGDGLPSARSCRENEVETLTQQLCESESQRLDLEDRVQTLEEALQDLHNSNIAQQPQTCDETLAAKDQYIRKLQDEVQELQREAQKLVSNYLCICMFVECHLGAWCELKSLLLLTFF